MAMRPKQPNRSQLNLLLPISNKSKSQTTRQTTTERAKIEQSRQRLLGDLERAGLAER